MVVSGKRPKPKLRGSFLAGGIATPAALVAAIIAFVAGVVSLTASRDFARAAPGGQEGPRK